MLTSRRKPVNAMRKRPPTRALVNDENADRPATFVVIFNAIFERLREWRRDLAATAGANGRFFGRMIAHEKGNSATGTVTGPFTVTQAF